MVVPWSAKATVDTVLRIGAAPFRNSGRPIPTPPSTSSTFWKSRWARPRPERNGIGSCRSSATSPAGGAVRETAYLEGRTEGEAKGIPSVLEVRGIPVTDSVRERITSCTGLDRMDTWLERSRTVERAEDLFDEEGNADKPIA